MAVGPSMNLTQDDLVFSAGHTTEESACARRLASKRCNLLSTSVVIFSKSGCPGMEVRCDLADLLEP